MLDEKSLEEFEYWYEKLSHDNENFEFGGWIKSVNENQTDPRIIESLGKLERIFRPLANRASLVTREIQGEFLFTGDVDGTVLNKHLNFSDLEYFLVEAPHHGGFYGEVFNNVETEILVISRKSTYRPRAEFFRDVIWRILMDAGKLGTCILEKGVKKGRIHAINMRSDKAFAYFLIYLI
jgi:hypothetical protein